MLESKSSFDIPVWVTDHRKRTWKWFTTVQDKEDPSIIRLCTKGDLLKPSSNAGLGWSALGFKLFQMLNFSPFYEKDLEKLFIQRIKSFQVSSGKNCGYFEDPALLRKIDKWSLFPPKKNIDLNARRAETRQAIVALSGVNALPDTTLDFMFETEDEVRTFIRGLPWETNPWHCGSHVSHLIVFLETNRMLLKQKEKSKLLSVVFDELDRLLRPEVGSWFKGAPPEYQKINAAMKVYSGYDFLNKRPPQLESLIDYALDAAIETGACNHVDLMFVLHIATKHTDYRRPEIEKLAFGALETIKQHIQVDGGLCYNFHGTQTGYYGAKVSRGLKKISDLHGTKLYTWSLVLISDILGWRENLGWRLPVT